jgi:hypothetical protein
VKLIKPVHLTSISFTCAKTARFLQANRVENLEQLGNLYTKQFSNQVDEKSYPFLGTNHQQLIHRVISSKNPVFAGHANVNNIFSLH